MTSAGGIQRHLNLSNLQEIQATKIHVSFLFEKSEALALESKEFKRVVCYFILDYTIVSLSWIFSKGPPNRRGASALFPTATLPTATDRGNGIGTS